MVADDVGLTIAILYTNIERVTVRGILIERVIIKHKRENLTVVQLNPRSKRRLRHVAQNPTERERERGQIEETVHREFEDQRG